MYINGHYYYDEVINEGLFKKKNIISKIKLTDSEISKIAKLFEKELKPIVDKYNTSKTKEIRKEIDDYINDTYRDYEPEERKEYIKDEFSPYDKRTPRLVFKYSDNDDQYITFDFGEEYSQDLNIALCGISEKIGKELKEKDSVKDLITKITIYDGDEGLLGIGYNAQKCKEYLDNSSVKESYIEEALFKKKPKKTYIQPTREDYNLATKLARKILFKNPLLENAYEITPYKINKDYPNEIKIIDFSYRTDRLSSMSGDEWNNFLDNVMTPAVVEFEDELKKYDMQLEVTGTKDGYMSIKKYTTSKNESYNSDKGEEVKVNKINTLANIARNYGITTSGSLRDDIISECTDILDSLNTVEESVINHDISLLPVYTVNEGLFKKNTSKKEEEKVVEKPKYIAPSKEHHSKAVQIAKRLLGGKYKNIKSAFKEEKYDPRDNYTPILYYEVDSLKLMTRDDLMEFGNDAGKLCNDIKLELEKSKIYVNMDMDGTTNGFVYIVNNSITESFDEGYAIDLDSLKFVVESKEISLEEAIQEIRDVNYIGDTIPMYCVLPENINENMSLESFIDLNNILNESNITPVCIREYSETEFITEAMTEEKLEKKIAQYEKSRDALIKKKEEFTKMSKEDQVKFCVGKSLKNIIIGTIVSIPTAGIGSVVYATYQEMRGENPILGPKMYINNLNIWITAYNTDITNFKKKLKELKKEK